MSADEQKSDSYSGKNSEEDSVLPSNCLPKPSLPIPKHQFGIATILVWTAAIGIFFGISSLFFSVDGPDARILLIFFAPPLICAAVLFDRVLTRDGGLNFNLILQFVLAVGLGLYSFSMLMLATAAFYPDWKGAKGKSWFYYTLDGLAGMTLWPIYLLGVILFVDAVFKPEKAKSSVMYPVATATCAVISGWYVFASLYLKFSNIFMPFDDRALAIVPALTALSYGLFTVILYRNRLYGWADVKRQAGMLKAWMGGLFVSILIKYPLALNLYVSLTDDPPEDCFIVTAAARGHQRVVGSWRDTRDNRIFNQQLITFWEFESWMKRHQCRTHRLLRSIYNRIGPTIARTIIFRWQADCVYLCLKPLEWTLKRFLGC